MLQLTNLSFKRGSTTILKKITCSFAPGSITCIIGPSGAGKSTLLSCIAQLITDYSGTVTVDGQDLAKLSNAERAQILGLVFQQGNLFPQMTALANCAQPLIVTQNRTPSEAEDKAETVLAKLGMLEYKNAYSAQLSGGQQQRVALARALVYEPQIVCLDEPTSSLDTDNQELLIKELLRLKDEGTTLIITSHDRSFVQRIADRVLTLSKGTLGEGSLGEGVLRTVS